MFSAPSPFTGTPLVAPPPRAQIARIGVIVALFYALVLPIITKDVGYYYGPWLDHIWATGPIAAFAKPFGNYTPPYLYLLALLSPLKLVLSDAAVIKSVSLVGTALLALAMWMTLKQLGTGNGAMGALAVIALPSAILNAALLGQCDALYVAPIVMAVGAAATRRPLAMLAWFGFALSIKLQAILCAPFFLAMLLAWREPVWRWWPAPAAFVAAMLPAWALGWPGSDLATIYLRQARDLDGIFLNAPNIWTIVELAIGSAAGFFTLALAAACAASLAYLVWMRRHATRLDRAQLLNAALLAPLITAGLLPRMHERYFFAADILALLLAWAAPGRRGTMLVVLVQLGSCLAMLGYLTGADMLAALAAVPMLIATIMVTRSLIAPPR